MDCQVKSFTIRSIVPRVRIGSSWAQSWAQSAIRQWATTIGHQRHQAVGIAGWALGTQGTTLCGGLGHREARQGYAYQGCLMRKSQSVLLGTELGLDIAVALLGTDLQPVPIGHNVANSPHSVRNVCACLGMGF